MQNQEVKTNTGLNLLRLEAEALMKKEPSVKSVESFVDLTIAERNHLNWQLYQHFAGKFLELDRINKMQNTSAMDSKWPSQTAWGLVLETKHGKYVHSSVSWQTNGVWNNFVSFSVSAETKTVRLTILKTDLSVYAIIEIPVAQHCAQNSDGFSVAYPLLDAENKPIAQQKLCVSVSFDKNRKAYSLFEFAPWTPTKPSKLYQGQYTTLASMCTFDDYSMCAKHMVATLTHDIMPEMKKLGRTYNALLSAKFFDVSCVSWMNPTHDKNFSMHEAILSIYMKTQQCRQSFFLPIKIVEFADDFMEFEPITNLSAQEYQVIAADDYDWQTECIDYYHKQHDACIMCPQCHYTVIHGTFDYKNDFKSCDIIKFKILAATWPKMNIDWANSVNGTRLLQALQHGIKNYKDPYKFCKDMQLVNKVGAVDVEKVQEFVTQVYNKFV
jgi:hypothetical protein